MRFDFSELERTPRQLVHDLYNCQRDLDESAQRLQRAEADCDEDQREQAAIGLNWSQTQFNCIRDLIRRSER